jgi:hypothetical protein
MENNTEKYVCPYDLLRGDVKKGTIFIPDYGEYFFKPIDNIKDEAKVQAEIVRTWEKYEEPKRLRIVDLADKEVIHCETREEASRILKLAEKLGFYTNSNVYDFYRSRTCYNIKNGCYGYFDFYKAEGYKVHKSTDFPDELNQPEKKEVSKSVEALKGIKGIDKEITEADLIVGKTVLIDKDNKSEHLILAKKWDYYLFLDLKSYGEQKIRSATFQTIKDYFTIKNEA